MRLNTSSRYLCACKNYNFGRPHSVSRSAWCKHIKAAETDEEKQRIRAAKRIDDPDQPDHNEMPMNGSLSSTQRRAVVLAMSKRWRESAANTSRGRRKCARTSSNRPTTSVVEHGLPSHSQSPPDFPEPLFPHRDWSPPLSPQRDLSALPSPRCDRSPLPLPSRDLLSS
ncbi:hypothetical protein EDC04DRAFT_1604731 [Pisolithus marmoratus]|nr:hypothetical protein EDC04DRAFT_1604731 [Pisolithus marmoratus]